MIRDAIIDKCREIESNLESEVFDTMTQNHIEEYLWNKDYGEEEVKEYLEEREEEMREELLDEVYDEVIDQLKDGDLIWITS